MIKLIRIIEKIYYTIIKLISRMIYIKLKLFNIYNYKLTRFLLNNGYIVIFIYKHIHI